MVGYSNGTIPFNHGQLCQMLRSASEKELNDVIMDVQKEKERRRQEKKNEYIQQINQAISDALDEGYTVVFYQDSSCDCADYIIDENSKISLDIELE